MESYRTVLQSEKADIVMDSEIGYVESIPVSSGGSEIQKAFDTLENIIQTFNERMGGNFSKKQENICTTQILEVIP